MSFTPDTSTAAGQLSQIMPVPGQAPSLTASPPVPASFAGFRCGQCGGEDIQKLSVVHESGTTTINARTSGLSTGVGIARGGLGIGSAITSSRTTGTQMSALARRAAPPKTKRGAALIALGIIAALVSFGLLGIGAAVAVLAVCGVFGYLGIRYNQDVYPGLRQAWEQSWLCHRCGTISRITQP